MHCYICFTLGVREALFQPYCILLNVGDDSKHLSNNLCVAFASGLVQGMITGIRGLCNGLGPALYGFIFFLFDVELSEIAPIQTDYSIPLQTPSEVSAWGYYLTRLIFQPCITKPSHQVKVQSDTWSHVPAKLIISSILAVIILYLSGRRVCVSSKRKHESLPSRVCEIVICPTLVQI